MKLALLTSLAACTLFACTDGRPNILIVYVDDLGWRDTSYMGSDFYETPNIDALAEGGMIFTNAYACAANCTPSRACLMSGQYTPRHEMFNVGTRARGDARFRRLRHEAGVPAFAPEIQTWAEVLQAAGYRTAMFGKWQLGTSPVEEGFDVALNYRNLEGMNQHFGRDGSYLTDVLTDQAIEFMKDPGGKPWIVFLSHVAVHVPLQTKPDLLAKYVAKERGTLHGNPEMGAMIQAVDDSVGRVVAALGGLGELDDTIVFFTSDNGGFGPVTDMDPLWGYKGTYYEGGIRVPFFVNWPGHIGPGQTTSEPIIGVDLLPTLVELAGAEMPDQPADGASLVPLFTGEVNSLGPRALFWHFPAYLESYDVFDEQRDPLFRTRPCGVVMLGNYKLHQYFEDGSLELYDLSVDPGEQMNLAESRPMLRDDLLRTLEMWRSEVGATIPTEANPEFDAAAERAARSLAVGGRRAAWEEPD